MERALQYMNGGKASAQARRMAASPKGGRMQLKAAPVEAEKIYAFNIEGGGFIIASADSRTLPVLGYSDSDSIDWESIPENMRSWLKQYDEAIATLGHRTDFRDGEQTTSPSYGQGTFTAKPSRRAARKPVEPLIKTHWNQSAPYWDQVPTYQGPEPALRNKQCYVGCVATAMAQVMNYWQWPKTLPDGLPDYDFKIPYNNQNYTWHLGALPPTKFEWELMLNDYDEWNPETEAYDPLGTEQQRKAVATLMRYCGQSVKMKYGPAERGGSAAYCRPVAKALVDFFDYNTPQHIRHRFIPSIDKWEEIIYGELAAGRPALFCSYSDSGGHAFLCDGYDGNGLFHINWGWGGSDDGYFSLSVLNPYNNTGAGSGSSGIGFCIDQEAIIYTDPKMEPQPMLIPDFDNSFYQYAPIHILDKDTAEFYYSFYEAYNEVADHALGSIDSEGNLHPLFMVYPNNNIVYSYQTHMYNTFKVEIDSTLFSAGQYVTLYPMLRLRHPGEEWQVIPPTDQSLTVGCDENGRFFMHSKEQIHDMLLTGVDITKGTGRLDERSDLTIRVRNNETSDYISNIVLFPVYLGHITREEYGTAPPLAEGKPMICSAYIPANSEGEVTFSFVPEYGGTVVFCAYSDNRFIGQLPLELNNDTLANYNAYVENKSYLSRDGDQWYWNVELADRLGIKMSHWVPSESLYLRVLTLLNDEEVMFVKEIAGLKEYLAALPDCIGTGNYTFGFKVPVDVGQPGKYDFTSYIAKVVDDKLVSYCCTKVYSFIIDEQTGIKSIDDLTINNLQFKAGEWYTLDGRKIVNSKPSKGIYIHNGKKVIIQ